MHPPKIFISATSGDLRSVRQIVKEALLTINCHPVEQTNFEPDARTVENMLRGKIGDCQALIHICGLRYGAEPDVASLPPGTPRRSYTQWEYHIGRQLQDERGDDHFRVYTFICPEDFHYDPEPDTEPQEKRDLQKAHRSRLFDDPHLREKPKDGDDLKLRVLALQEQVFALKQEQAEVKAEVLKNRHLGIKAFAVLLLVLGGIHFGQTEIIANQKQPLDAPALRARLTESSERTLQQELASADKAAKSTDRQRLRETAEAAHVTRLTGIGDLAARLSELFAAGQASSILVEMLRIVDAEGVDAALAYEEKQRPALLESIKTAKKVDRERSRRSLQPILQAAQIQATKGDSPAARASYQEILALEPDWPEAIDAFAWFLFQTAYESTRDGSQHLALADAEAMLTLTAHRQSLTPTVPLALIRLSMASALVADVLILGRQSSDMEKAYYHYQRSLEFAERLLTANPDSHEAAWAVSSSLVKLGNFLSCRDKSGDSEKAFGCYHRDIEINEKCLTPNLKSYAFDMLADNASDSMRRLRDFLTRRGQPGDMEMALDVSQRNLELRKKVTSYGDSFYHEVSVSLDELQEFFAKSSQADDAERKLGQYQRDLEISEKLLVANPDSFHAASDVSVSLQKFGDLLARRGQPGDMEKARARFQRHLETSEKLLNDHPESAAATWDVVESHYKMARFANDRGDAVGKTEHRRACYNIFAPRIARGVAFDSHMMDLFEDLKKEFGK